MTTNRSGMPVARWLAILVALFILVPAVAAAIGWVIARDVQNSQLRSRADAATHVLADPQPRNPAWLAAAVARLQRLDVPAHLAPADGDQHAGTPVTAAKQSAAKSNKPHAAPNQQANAPSATPNFKPADAPGPTASNRYREIDVREKNLDATLLIPRGNPAVAWLAALASGLATLLAAILAASAATRRWIARPLAQLASGAEQIAAGEFELEHVLSPVREITVVSDAQRGTARSLADAILAARAAEHERRFLVTAIAHDLRTPLFTLRGSLQAIELGIGDHQALRRAQQKAAHLDMLVNDLFTFSRLEYAPHTQDRRPFDVRDTAQRAVDSIATLPATRACDITVELPDKPIILRSDETAVARILTNLLDNAIRHARHRTKLRVRRMRGRVALEVSDDGPGFAPHILPRIFDPFYQADNSRNENGGAGLGLTIVHRLTTALGGDVTASNDPNSGALIAVNLPTTSPTPAPPATT
jgi:signal transduction histidine kinase